MDTIDLIRRERIKQQQKGFDALDDQREADALASCAGEICLQIYGDHPPAPENWPGGLAHEKQRDRSRFRQLVIAAALIVAELDRLDRDRHVYHIRDRVDYYYVATSERHALELHVERGLPAVAIASIYRVPDDQRIVVVDLSTQVPTGWACAEWAKSAECGLIASGG